MEFQWIKIGLNSGLNNGLKDHKVFFTDKKFVLIKSFKINFEKWVIKSKIF